MSQRVKARGHVSGALTVLGTHDGPSGSGLKITMFVSPDGAESADIEEAVGRSSKRRLVRLDGAHVLLRAHAWIDGYVAGRAGPPPITQYPRPQPKKRS